MHRTVLLEEAVAALSLKRSGSLRFVDATFGRGGHTREILKRYGEACEVLAIDKDPQAILEGEKIARKVSGFRIRQGSFADLARYVAEQGWDGRVDGILFDLGVSSPQLDQADRGFSFLRDGPLDMRMDPGHGMSASAWLATADKEEIVSVLKEYGEERFARRIATAIVEERAVTPIVSTARLASIVEQAMPVKPKGIHPATRTFQGIRIFINGELKDLRVALPQALDVLAPGGRLVVISFHSLEDRIVKRFMKDQARGDRHLPPDLPVTVDALQVRLKLVGKPLKPSNVEVADNPRCRSAIMRVGEKVA